MNNELDPKNSEHKLAHVSSNEGFDEQLESQIGVQYEEQPTVDDRDEQRDWLVDGSEQDDLDFFLTGFADYNQNESMDY